MWKSKTKQMRNKRKRSNDNDSDVDIDEDIVPMGGGLFDAFMPKKGVCVEDNHIYFYTDVTQSTVENLVKAIRVLNCDLGAMALRYGTEPTIYLHINSDGGEVYAALAAVDTIVRSKIPITTVVEGCAASAATLISISGKHRQMLPHSHFMIHEITSDFWGKMEQIEVEFANLDKLMNIIINVYKNRTNMNTKDIRKFLRTDEMWDADTCLQKGLIDEIL